MPKLQIEKKLTAVEQQPQCASFESVFNGFIDNIVDDTKEVDILTFVESPYYLNIKSMRPAQRFILKVFYNIPFDNVQKTILIRSFPHDEKGHYFTEYEYAQYLINQERVNLKTPDGFEKAIELLLCCGRRGGKTFVSSVITAYETYKLIIKDNPQAYYNMAADETIKIVNIASSGDQALELATQIQNRIFNSEWFLPYIASFNGDTIFFKTKHDIKKMKDEEQIYGQPLKKRATIKVETLLCSARGSRGGSAIVVILDELAHFVDNEGNRGGKTIYKSLTPSGATFGADAKVICLSSPYTKSGIFYELYVNSAENHKIRMLQMPTWEMNVAIDFEFLKNEYTKDTESFWTEYGAQFTTTVSGFFKFPERIYECVSVLSYNDSFDEQGQPKKIPIYRAETTSPRGRHLHYLALDPATNDNGYALALVHCELGKDGKLMVIVDRWKKWSVDDPEFSAFDFIDIELIDSYVLELTRTFRIAKVVYDQFESAASIQKFVKVGIDAVKTHFSRQYNMKIYKNLRSIIYDKKISLLYHEEGLKELVYLQEKKVGKKQFMIQAPKSGDVTTDDMADVLANAVNIAIENELDRPHASIARTSNSPSIISSKVVNANEVSRTRLRQRSNQNALLNKLAMARRVGLFR